MTNAHANVNPMAGCSVAFVCGKCGRQTMKMQFTLTSFSMGGSFLKKLVAKAFSEKMDKQSKGGVQHIEILSEGKTTMSVDGVDVSMKTKMGGSLVIVGDPENMTPDDFVEFSFRVKKSVIDDIEKAGKA